MMLLAGWAVETVTCQSLSDDLISHQSDTRFIRYYVVGISTASALDQRSLKLDR